MIIFTPLFIRLSRCRTRINQHETLVKFFELENQINYPSWRMVFAVTPILFTSYFLSIAYVFRLGHISNDEIIMNNFPLVIKKLCPCAMLHKTPVYRLFQSFNVISCCISWHAILRLQTKRNIWQVVDRVIESKKKMPVISKKTFLNGRWSRISES